MKKIIFLLFLGAAVGSVFQSIKTSKQESNPLLLQNIEALASDEVPDAYHCMGSGCVDCPATHTKVKYVMIGYSLGK